MTSISKYESFSLDLVRYLARRDRVHLCRFLKGKEGIIPKEIFDVVNFLARYFDLSTKDVADWSEVAYHATVSGVELNADVLAALDKATTAASDNAVQAYIDMYFSEEIAEQASKASALGGMGIDKIQGLLDDRLSASVRLQRAVPAAPLSGIEEIVAELTTSGLKWFLEPIQGILGDVRHEFLIVGSRPDGGKTTFLAHTAWFMANQLPVGKFVLWCNNEEKITRVQRRVVQSWLNLTTDELADNFADVRSHYDASLGTKIRYLEDADNIGKIERAITNYPPGLVIIDQLYKVRAPRDSKGEIEAEKFRQLCEWARGVGKHHNCPVIVTNQLDGSAEGQRFPDMGCLYGSKTGAQGEADAIIMIGRDTSGGSDPDMRYIYTPKNKLTGKVMSCALRLDKERARYCEVHSHGSM